MSDADFQLSKLFCECVWFRISVWFKAKLRRGDFEAFNYSHVRILAMIAFQQVLFLKKTRIPTALPEDCVDSSQLRKAIFHVSKFLCEFS